MPGHRFRRLPSTPASAPEDGLTGLVLGLLDGGPLEERELLLRTGAEANELDAVLDDLEHRGLIVDAGDAQDHGEIAELPDGVMPWNGEDMPSGHVSVPPRDGGAPAVDWIPDPEDGAPLSEPPAPSSRPPELESVSQRRLYEREFHGLTVNERIALARTTHGERLDALCLDPEPSVIGALLDNSELGLNQARLVALHHRNARGLEILCRRVEWLRDAHVSRNLLRNPQLSEGSLARLLAGKRLRDLYKLCVDRDLPELTRTRIRAQLRKSFTVAEPEERIDLVMKTEGRALTFLIGCTFDGRSTQLLAAQTFVSSLLIQNLARFAATPPAVLAKLLHQPMVRRQPQLRALLLRHPNVPSEAKRG